MVGAGPLCTSGRGRLRETTSPLAAPSCSVRLDPVDHRAAVLLLLFAGAASPEAQTQPAPLETVQKSVRDALETLDRAARRFGDPLLAVAGPADLDAVLAQTVSSAEFHESLSAVMAAVTGVRVALPMGNLGGEIEAAIARLPPQLQPIVKQGMAVNAELIHRNPVNLTALPAPPEEIARFLIDESATDPVAMAVVAGLAYAFAVARMVDQPLLERRPRSVRDDVAVEIAHRWLEATRVLLRKVDPTQEAIDRAIDQFPDDARRALVRLAYQWKADVTNGSVFVVWLVLHDDAMALALKVIGNVDLESPLRQELGTLGIHAPLFVRPRLASEWV